MLYAVCPTQKGYEIFDRDHAQDCTTLWIDLFNPTAEEKSYLESQFPIEIPTKADIQEIEQSSRLYLKNSCMYLTTSIPVERETDRLETALVTFILSEKSIITVRYEEIPIFNAILIHPNRIKFQYDEYRPKLSLVNALLAHVIDYLADLLEKSISEVSSISKELFTHSHMRNPNTAKPPHNDFGKILFKIGVQGNALSVLRDSLLSFSRLLSFLTIRADHPHFGLDQPLLSTIEKDVASISDHGLFVSSKIAFLLDATLGMITIEQNVTIKIFSIASVIFLPPTLLASIWGMNYKEMPELTLSFGYPLALLCIAISSILPYYYFKKKGWL